MKKKLRHNTLTSVFKTNKRDLTYIRDTLADIIAAIDPNIILQDIMSMDNISRPAAFLKLCEVQSKLAVDISKIEKDKFIMNLDKIDDDQEIFVVLDSGVEGLHLTDKPTPRMIDVAERQQEIIDEIIEENKVDDISHDITSSNTLSETHNFTDIQYVEQTKIPHTPKRRKPIGY